MPVFLLLCLFIFTSCDSDNTEQKLPKAFFDLKGFINGQIISLGQQHPMVSKTMAMGDESSNISTKEIDWKKELELFVQADINKPAFRQSYNVSQPDSVSYLYSLKTGQDLPVKYLKVKLHKSHGLPVRIDAFLVSENKLYQSEKNISLLLHVREDVASIVSYKITGFQKLATMKKKPFLVAATLTF